MNKTFYITTPIYYANDKPHIGHAYTSTVSDMIARFMRLDGYQVKFLSGTDEHGQKVQKSAEKAGIKPEEFVTLVSQNFRDMHALLDISNDDFIRTTQKRHINAAQYLWKLLEERGQIYLGKYAGWYALRDEAFYAESELINGKAPTGADVEWVEEESYFFKLSEWQEPLLKYYEANPDFIRPTSRRNEVIKFVERGLKDLSISRTTFSWGIPVPNNPNHVMYVWFDALTNYISAIGYPETDNTNFMSFWPADLHMVGKDIVRFHAVYWPAMLMAASLRPPRSIFAHGFWTHAGQKMSKSLNNGVDPIALVEEYGVDQVRYFLTREVVFGADGDYSKEAFISRVNSNLANDLGNLVQRVMSMIDKNCDGKIPSYQAFTEEDEHLLQSALELVVLLRPIIETQDLHRYGEVIWGVIGDANRYIDREAPWVLKKVDRERMETVLYVLAEVMRYIGILIQPIMPRAASKMLDLLAVSPNKRDFQHLTVIDALKPGFILPKPYPLFPRIQTETTDIAS